MVVAGAKGFAKEILEVLVQLYPNEPIAFYDDINHYQNPILFNKYPILQNQKDIITFFNKAGMKYCLGLGNSILREKMTVKFDDFGGQLTSVISPFARIGSYNVQIGVGACILPGAVISNDCIVGKGALVYFNSIITHDCIIGDFSEISPAAVILGRCTIGSFTLIGGSATILPDISVGSNSIIAAGSVVTSDVPDNTMVAGIPAKIKKIITQ